MAQYPRSSDVSRLVVDGWNHEHVNGGGSRAWGKSNENHVPQEPGACWDANGDSAPLGLQPPSMEDREVRPIEPPDLGFTADPLFNQAFSTDINSPLKPPSMNKDGANAAAVNGRKASLSQGVGNAFGTSSPSSAARPGTRRRETANSNTLGLNSPTATGRSGRDDASPWFSRKSGDLKETETTEDPESERETANKLPPFGNLMRSNTAGSTGMGSIWSQSNPGTPGTGNFGNFAFGGSAVGDKRTGGTGGGSRLAHLMPKDSAESAPGRQGEVQNPLNQSSWRARQRTDTDPFGEDGPSGSAALGGAQETSAAPSQSTHVGTLGTPVKGSTSDFGMSGLHLGGHHDDNGPTSPSETNPFRSPPADRHGHDEGDSGAPKAYPGFPQDTSTGFNPLQRALSGAPEGHDRSQSSSVGAKGFPLGHMSAWGAPGVPSSGTPDRERSNFGGGPFSPALFNSMGDIQSPSLGDLSGLFGPGSAVGSGTNSIGRGSKMGSLFPATMQAQMQQVHEQHEGLGDSAVDPRLAANPLGAIGRGAFAMPMRNAESPMRSNRGVFEELFPSSDASRNQGLYGTAEPGQPGGAGTGSQSYTPVSGGMPFGANPSAPEPPSAQARTMVMPDRMRWVYLDPQGQVQGPFTGLEMNDWYKAHFFTPDLRVKKVEDTEFEPLGQLIRRIGNSREPFLVPQVGIAHGPPASAPGFPSNNSGGVVPPLSGVFPSFGRTLTAEEQNNLERRKQEEQYMMAQQREYAMRQHAMTRFQGQQPGLQHHSSAQSLQSQPSFGSITSPIGIQGQMPQQPVGGMPQSAGPSGSFFDGAGEGRGPQAGGHSSSGNDVALGEEELANLTMNERHVLAALQSNQSSNQPIGAPGDASLHSGLPGADELEHDPEGFRERLEEFHQLRAEREAAEAAPAGKAAGAPEMEDQQTAPQEPAPQQVEAATPSRKAKGKKRVTDESGLSLTQQVQQTQAAAAAAQTVEPDMPMPFPPPSSTTPLPAPTAQRARSNLPDQYNRSRSGTPDDDHSATAQPPPLAPWAKEPGNDAHKGPSLKEIQEAEARKAAKAEEAAAAIRKAALEQEAALLREKEKQAASVAAGLPATSTWGHASPVSGGSPWVKPSATKAPAPGLGAAVSAPGKKTLAEIQREEELRKQKAKEVAMQTGAPVTSTTKSYANLAGKTGQPLVPSATSPAAPPAPAGAGWATVGAGGKVKIPTGPAAQSRSTSAASNIKPVAAAPIKPVPRPGPAAVASTGPSTNTAMDEFRKWAQRELSRGLNVNDSELLFYDNRSTRH